MARKRARVGELHGARARAHSLRSSHHRGSTPRRSETNGANQFANADDVEDLLPVDEITKRSAARFVKLLSGDKARAAELLGVDRKTLDRKLNGNDPNAYEALGAPPAEESVDRVDDTSARRVAVQRVSRCFGTRTQPRERCLRFSKATSWSARIGNPLTKFLPRLFSAGEPVPRSGARRTNPGRCAAGRSEAAQPLAATYRQATRREWDPVPSQDIFRVL